MKKGDKVVCINNRVNYSCNRVLTINKVYVVNDTWSDNILINNDIQDVYYYPMKLFKPIDIIRNDLINKLLESK